jgi:hypothetical protein
VSVPREVQSRHADFFRFSLGFEPIGEERLNARVSTQEALLCVDIKSVLQRLLKLGGRPDIAAEEATLFPYGFSPEESAGVVRRLAALVTTGAG